MSESVTEIPQERVITSENLPQWMKAVAVLREEHGKDFRALRLIRCVRDEAIKLEDHESVVNLYWEDYLVGKHLTMQARDEKMSDFKKAMYSEYGLYLMKDSSKAALEYIDKHEVEALRPRSHRFLGEVESLSGGYVSAIEHYKEGIKLYEKMEDPKQRWNSLEFEGFLAEAYIRVGSEDRGIELAKKTFKKYDTGDGLLMKEASYYQWAVWKSGCVFRVLNALLDMKYEASTDEWDKWGSLLREAGSILCYPDGGESKDGFSFDIRKAEFAKVLKRLTE